MLLPLSLVIPTKDRFDRLAKTLRSLAAQSAVPREVLVIDGGLRLFCEISEAGGISRLFEHFSCIRADRAGAAAQRNQGARLATMEFIAFCDDDIDFEADCVDRMWQAIQSDSNMGGVNAMIVNQRYEPPGLVSRTLFTIVHGRREKSFAGKVIGPAINLLPEDRDELPEVVPVEWLNTTCTMYRREALPIPPFDAFFSGYSLMEDLALSLEVGKSWKLANARTARIFHDSQPGKHKQNLADLAEMELLNRHYIMTKVLGRSQVSDYLRLLLWQVFQIMVSLARPSMWPTLAQSMRGKWRAVRRICRHRRSLPT